MPVTTRHTLHRGGAHCRGARPSCDSSSGCMRHLESQRVVSAGGEGEGGRVRARSLPPQPTHAPPPHLIIIITIHEHSHAHSPVRVCPCSPHCVLGAARPSLASSSPSSPPGDGLLPHISGRPSSSSCSAGPVRLVRPLLHHLMLSVQVSLLLQPAVPAGGLACGSQGRVHRDRVVAGCSRGGCGGRWWWWWWRSVRRSVQRLRRAGCRGCRASACGI